MNQRREQSNESWLGNKPALDVVDLMYGPRSESDARYSREKYSLTGGDMQRRLKRQVPTGLDATASGLLIGVMMWVVFSACPPFIIPLIRR